MVSKKPTQAPVTPAPARKPPRSAAPPLALRPMARAERMTLFEREVRERLSRSALALLFAQAAVISEGQISEGAAGPVFSGSTMMTMELAKIAETVRDACDARCAQRLATLLAADPAAQERIRAIAAGEAERIAKRRPRAVETEIKVRARGATVFVDVDVEAAL